MPLNATHIRCSIILCERERNPYRCRGDGGALARNTVSEDNAPERYRVGGALAEDVSKYFRPALMRDVASSQVRLQCAGGGVATLYKDAGACYNSV